MKEFKEFLSKLDLSDVRLLLIGIVLFVIPMFYLFFVVGIRDKTAVQRSYTQSPSRQSAFNLTSSRSKKAAAANSKNRSIGVSPRVDVIEDELNRTWANIQKVPRRYNYPANLPRDTKLMLEAEDSEILSEANSLLDGCDYEGAEKAYLEAIKNSGSNEFLELYALGGLMEVYQMTGNIIKFREAFGKYVNVAQQLKHVYGPLADNIARAQQMFEQLAKADPAKVREHLTRHNLANKTNVTYDEFIQSMDHTREWFPTTLEEPDPKLPDYLRSGYGG
jgi:tetratricopeptide (TPR) repeat protein